MSNIENLEERVSHLEVVNSINKNGIKDLRERVSKLENNISDDLDTLKRIIKILVGCKTKMQGFEDRIRDLENIKQRG